MDTRLKKLVSTFLSCASMFGSSSSAAKRKFVPSNSRNRYVSSQKRLRKMTKSNNNVFKNKNNVKMKNRRSDKHKQLSVSSKKRVFKNRDAIKRKNRYSIREQSDLSSGVENRKNDKTSLIQKVNSKKSPLSFENLWNSFSGYVKKHPVVFSSEVGGGIAGLAFIGYCASVLREGEDYDPSKVRDKYLAYHEKAYHEKKKGHEYDSVSEYIATLIDEGDMPWTNTAECLIKNSGIIDFGKTRNENYSLAAVTIRRLWDYMTQKSAPERLKSSFKRIQRSPKGACWDLAFAVDYMAMRLGFKHHHVLAYRLPGGIAPHTFNLFYVENKRKCGKNLTNLVEPCLTDNNVSHMESLEKILLKSYEEQGWYIYDPLVNYGTFLGNRANLGSFIFVQSHGVAVSNDYFGNDLIMAKHCPEDENEAEKFRRENPKYYLDSPPSGEDYKKHEDRYGWYIMEQINSDEKRTVGKMKWAKFLPENNENGSFAYWGDKLEEEFQTEWTKKDNNKIIFRDDKDEKVDYKYDPYLVFG